MKPRFFKSAPEFRRWLEIRHDSVLELWLGFHRKNSGRGGISYAEALDAALCFGWIDGLRKGLNETSFAIRFTPRKARSIWSSVNTKRARELEKLGLMMPPGLKALRARDPARSGIYAFENAARGLEAAHEQVFKANQAAWQYFQTQAKWYQRTACWWIASAKREETRLKRLATLIQDSKEARRLRHLSWTPKKRPG